MFERSDPVMEIDPTSPKSSGSIGYEADFPSRNYLLRLGSVFLGYPCEQRIR
jgi:hypothetical protein